VETVSEIDLVMSEAAEAREAEDEGSEQPDRDAASSRGAGS
jgi:hypothetical protein